MFLIPSTRRIPSDANTFRGFNRALDDMFSGFPAFAAGTGTRFPATDVVEDEAAVTLRIELPGVRSEDVDISLENDVLTIRAEKKREAAESEGQRHRVERSYGVFQRRFSLANTIDGEKVEAGLADGVLTVRLPKSEKARSRRIEVAS